MLSHLTHPLRRLRCTSRLNPPVISPITAYVYWPDPAQHVKGVRVHAAHNSIEVLASAAKELTADSEAAKRTETYAQCVARVKREYPVPPGNINAQKQMIELQCGTS